MKPTHTRNVVSLAVLLAIAGLYPVAQAQRISQRGAELSLEIVGQLGGEPRAVAVKGNYAYIALGARLSVLDVSSKSNPRLLPQSVLFDDLVEAVTVAPTAAQVYVATGDSGLHILDIADPLRPVECGALDTPGSAADVAIDGTRAYVADSDEGLRIVDVHDAQRPREIGHFATASSAKGIAVQGGYAYVAVHSAGLEIIDVQLPSGPSLIGRFDTPGYARAVDVSGAYVCVAEEARWSDDISDYVGGGLRMIDVTDSRHPVASGYASTSGFEDRAAVATAVCMRAGYAYVADLIGGLRVIQLDPAAPDPERRLREAGSYTGQDLWAMGLDVNANWVYLVDAASGVCLVDVVQPSQPALKGRYYQHLSSVDAVDVVPGYAFLAAGGNGLCVVDVSNPAMPAEIKALPLAGWASDVKVSSSRAYVAASYGGVHIVDLGDPAIPRLLGSYAPEGMIAYAVGVEADTAYVSDGTSTLRLLNVGSPSSPQLRGSCELPYAQTRAATAVGGRAYVAAGTVGVQVVDVSQPGSPALIGRGVAMPDAWSVAVSGTLACVAAGVGGVRCLDIGTPDHPKEVGWLSTGYARSVAFQGHYVYVADQSSTLAVNVENPRSPYLAGQRALPMQAVDVAVLGSYVYVAAGQAGMYVVRIAVLPPTPTPTETATLAPTATRTCTATTTASPTATATSTATSTPRRRQVFLPAVLRNAR